MVDINARSSRRTCGVLFALKKRYKRDILQVIKLKREIKNPIKGFRTVNSHIGHMYCNFVNSAKNKMVSRYSDNDSDSSTENFYNSSRSAVSDIIINGPLDFFFHLIQMMLIRNSSHS